MPRLCIYQECCQETYNVLSLRKYFNVNVYALYVTTSLFENEYICCILKRKKIRWYREKQTKKYTGINVDIKLF